MSARLIRGGLLLAALVAVAWLAWDLRAVGLRDEGVDALETVPSRPLSAAEAGRARDALQDAQRFSADLEPLVNEGLLLVYTGKPDEAVAIRRRVNAEEPQNQQGWYLAVITATDRGAGARARRKLRQLDPWAGDALR